VGRQAGGPEGPPPGVGKKKSGLDIFLRMPFSLLTWDQIQAFISRIRFEKDTIWFDLFFLFSRVNFIMHGLHQAFFMPLKTTLLFQVTEGRISGNGRKVCQRGLRDALLCQKRWEQAAFSPCHPFTISRSQFVFLYLWVNGFR
jgi:hypothetical protein